MDKTILFLAFLQKDKARGAEKMGKKMIIWQSA